MKDEIQGAGRTAGMVFCLSLIALIVIPSAAFSGYEIPTDVLNGGGNRGNSASYRIVDSIGQSAIGTAASASYSEGIGFWYTIGDSVAGLGISGTVSYCPNGDPVPDALLALTGDSTYTIPSGPDGRYLFWGLNGGDYAVTPTKATDLGGVNATDALMVARYTAGLDTFAASQSLACDVNCSGSCNATDALKIVRYTAGVETLPCGGWSFDPINSSYSPLNSDATSQDYLGTRMGDVNASWIPDAGIPKTVVSAAQLAVSVPDLTVVEGEVARIPVTFEGRASIGAMAILLSFPTDLLSYEGIETFPDQLVPVVGCADGIVRIVWVDMTGSTPLRLDADSELVLRFGVREEDDGHGAIELLDGTELADGSGEVIPVELHGGDVSRGHRPEQYYLFQSFPNPFNARTSIRYSLARDSHVDLHVYDITGKRIITLVARAQSAGTRNVVWDGRDENGRDASSGIYLCRLSAGDFGETRKMLLIR